MATINDGGPAFPRPTSEDRTHGDQAEGNSTCFGYKGMSLRDYFAAHAPAVGPLWSFPVRMPCQRPKPDIVDKEWMNSKEIEAWDDEKARQKLIQWPWVWADAMLAARKAGQ